MANPKMTMWVVWGFLAVALGVYLWVGLEMVEEVEGGGSVVIVGAMALASAVCGWLSFVVRAVLRGTLVKLEGREVEGETKGAFTTAFAMAVWALAEAPGVFGLVLYVTGNGRDLFLGFWLVSVVLFLWHLPPRLLPGVFGRSS